MVNAQNSTDIAGLYNLGFSSPEGGSHLFVLENGDYAITYFGGIQTGKWESIKENHFKFTPHIKENTFEIFGRHNKDLQGETKIFFNGFENSETFIQLKVEKDEQNIMQRVFNLDANCFSYPYIHTYKSIANSISFMAINNQYNDTNPSIITFENPNGYNDFIVNFIEVNYYEAQPFIAKFEEDELIFNENNAKGRISLSEVAEDVEFIKKMIEKESDRDIIYLNPCYNFFGHPEYEEDQDINDHHVFNEQKNAYIDTEYYKEGVDYTNSEEFFEDMSIIYGYSALKDYRKKIEKYKIDENSLFQANCD
jgi:hypothetical protein